MDTTRAGPESGLRAPCASVDPFCAAITSSPLSADDRWI